MKSFRSLLIIYIVFCVLCLAGTASAQMPDRITGMTLETKSLNMEIGENYQFNPEILTEKVNGVTDIDLHIFSSDENVVKVSEELNTIEAVGGGTASVIVLTDDYQFSDVCKVSVNGAPKNLVGKGNVWEKPTSKQMAKINDPALKAFFEVLTKPEMAKAAAALASNPDYKFHTSVIVPQGRAKSLAEACRQIGMERVRPYDYSNTIVVNGTAEQYMYLLKSDSILSIDELLKFYPHEVNPILTLGGKAEELSSFSMAHDMGLYGENTAVVILDCTFATEHEEFEDRIIAQACFSSDGISTCHNGNYVDFESAALNPYMEESGFNFTHGTHVAGIAAGKGGVAPKAKLILINVFSASSYSCEIDDSYSTCYNNYFIYYDLWDALDYLVNGYYDYNDENYYEPLIDPDGTYQGYPVAAVNMSLGTYNQKQKKILTKTYFDEIFPELMNMGIIPVVASGNDGFKDGISFPAAAPSAFPVGALWDSEIPEVASYSNFSSLISIMAPGTSIYSSVSGIDEYDLMDGTSMAAPMVTGSFALLRQMCPNCSAAQLEALMTGMSTKSAAVGKLKKPILDFSNIEMIHDYFENGPEFTVYGLDKSLVLNFPAVPFNTNYTIKVYQGSWNGSFIEPGTLKTSQTVKNPKAVTIKKLDNDQVYVIDVSGYVKIGEEDIYLESEAYGMPMTQGAGFALTGTNNGSSVNCSWNPESGAELYVKYGFSADAKYDEDHDGEEVCISAHPNEPFYADLYKSVSKFGETFLSKPTSLQTVPVMQPYFKNVTAGSKKIYICFDADSRVTGREILLTDLVTNKTVKKTFSTKKSPQDALITGLINFDDYTIEVRNVIQLGKTPYYSEWKTWGGSDSPYTISPFAYTWDAKKYGNVQIYEPSMFYNVSLTAENKTATLNFDRDLAKDGYTFEIKPIEPNLTKSVKDVKGTAAQGSYKFTGLENGTVYKLRFQSYWMNGKLRLENLFYPNSSASPDGTYSGAQDTQWPGLYFVPLAAPEVSVSPQQHIDGDYTSIDQNLVYTIKKDLSADGFVIVWLKGDGSTSGWSNPKPWAPTTENEYESYYISDENVPNALNGMMFMLYKEYDGMYFYGPAVTLTGMVVDSDYTMGYGKDASAFDLLNMPEMADAAQIGGKIVLTAGFDEKSADPLAELESSYADDFIVESYDEIIEFDNETFIPTEELNGKAAEKEFADDPNIQIVEIEPAAGPYELECHFDGSEDKPETSVSMLSDIMEIADESDYTKETEEQVPAMISETDPDEDDDLAEIQPETAEPAKTSAPAQTGKQKEDVGLTLFSIWN